MESEIFHLRQAQRGLEKTISDSAPWPMGSLVLLLTYAVFFTSIFIIFTPYFFWKRAIAHKRETGRIPDYTPEDFTMTERTQMITLCHLAGIPIDDNKKKIEEITGQLESYAKPLHANRRARNLFFKALEDSDFNTGNPKRTFDRPLLERIFIEAGVMGKGVETLADISIQNI